MTEAVSSLRKFRTTKGVLNAQSDAVDLPSFSSRTFFEIEHPRLAVQFIENLAVVSFELLPSATRFLYIVQILRREQ